MTATNLRSVRAYGEFEFWFASIKVAAIVVFLVVGTLYVVGLWFGTGPHLANLTAHGGFAPRGLLPIFTGAVAATGFYFGAEIVTVAAAESAEPAAAVARATTSVISRVLLFYIGSIVLVVAIVPWNSPAIKTPYVSALAAIGVPAAAQHHERGDPDGRALGAQFRPLRFVADAARADPPRRRAAAARAGQPATARRFGRSWPARSSASSR